MYENLDTIPTTLFNPNKIFGRLYFDLDLIGFTLHCLEISGCHKVQASGRERAFGLEIYVT